MYAYIHVTGGRAFIALFQPYNPDTQKREKGKKVLKGRGLMERGLPYKGWLAGLKGYRKGIPIVILITNTIQQGSMHHDLLYL